jgi:hypothetical protein
MKRTLLQIIAIVFLSGCGSGEIKPFEEYEYNIELFKEVTSDNRELYSVKCFKRKYRIWLDYVGAKESFTEAPIKECDKLFGFQPKAKATLWALMEYVRKEASGCLQESFTGKTSEPALSGADKW